MLTQAIARRLWVQPRLRFGLSGALALVMLAGCAALPGLDQPGVAGVRRIQDRDEFKIEEVVYAYLLERDSWSSGEYSAVFLKAHDAQVVALMRKFPNHVPRLKTSDRVRMHDASSPIDKETGQPAIVLAAIASEPDGDRAEAIGTYFAGPIVSGKYVFQLWKVGGTWAIESVKYGGELQSSADPPNPHRAEQALRATAVQRGTGVNSPAVY